MWLFDVVVFVFECVCIEVCGVFCDLFEVFEGLVDLVLK